MLNRRVCASVGMLSKRRWRSIRRGGFLSARFIVQLRRDRLVVLRGRHGCGIRDTRLALVQCGGKAEIRLFHAGLSVRRFGRRGGCVVLLASFPRPAYAASAAGRGRDIPFLLFGRHCVASL